MERTAGVVLRVLLVLGMSVSIARAQSIQGTILGTVRDSSGASIPGSTVTVRNVETGFTRTGTTEANGAYRFSALPVGSYEIRAQQAGFQAELRTNVTLTVGQEAVVNFALQVGAITQTVEVVGEAPLVNTTNATLGALVNSQQITDLPLNGRNYNDLTLLQPGVVAQQVDNKSISSRGDWISINGAPLRSNNYMMDGTPVQNIGGASSASASNSTLGIDAIREWRVVTNPISAEYGNRMGGQMTIVSKGGTNSFHGSAFWYVRNDMFDARNFFDYTVDRRLPAFRRNQFGGSVGGPIKRDKFFVFGNYESLRERLGVTTVLNTLPAGCHGGAGATITNTACPALGSTASVAVSPVTAPLLALYPLPNLP
ncbi:MAG: carboxypeptidase regulatory-like domain-containing protein, partial [Terriglobia bacterium]